MSIICRVKTAMHSGRLDKKDGEKIIEALECFKTGKWNDDGTCSVCGTYLSLNLSKVKYCPECGAKMKGAEECR